MKKLKQDQLGHWCSFCEPKTTKAKYVQFGWYGKFSCEDHKVDLISYEKGEAEREQRMSDADYQTWAKL